MPAEDTCGYVFRNDGKLVASLWTIEGDDGPTAHFQAERIQDYLGNPIEGKSVRLTMAPVYAVGLSKSDVWYKQTAYSLDTPHMVPATAGDVVRVLVRVDNHREEPIAMQAQPRLAGRLEALQIAEVSETRRTGRNKTSSCLSPLPLPNRWASRI